MLALKTYMSDIITTGLLFKMFGLRLCKLREENRKIKYRRLDIVHETF